MPALQPDVRSEAQGYGPPSDRYDVVVLGGALSGASFATLLKRWRPAARILVIERRALFDRKVGEATVEVSGFFLHRALGLYDTLSREHLPKHGLRFWFTDSSERSLAEMSEVGPSVIPLLPSFQLDRSRLDERVLALASEEGCEVARPARVASVECGWPESRVTFGVPGEQRQVTARWVIDATGRRCLLGRQLDLIRRIDDHPTAAVWARWRGVGDLDGPTVAGGSAPTSSRRSSDGTASRRLADVAASRRLATNHFCGYGWWCWAIPLAGGETSIGLVYNKELFELPREGSSLAERYRSFVTSRAGLRELLSGAAMEEGDCRGASHLPYCTERYAAKGWALVGDAASFLDPYYSPGLDHVAMSVWATLRLVDEDLAGELEEATLDERVERHNEHFLRSYGRWLGALYRGKYEILGDAELASAAFLFDTAMYHLGIVTPIYRAADNLGNPTFGLRGRPSTRAYQIMLWFNRRMNRLARFRARAGSYGRRNSGWRLYAKSPGPGRQALAMLFQGLRIWLRVEREYLFHRLRHGGVDLSAPVAPPAQP
jgi:flavin-dependent dehydrogenase